MAYTVTEGDEGLQLLGAMLRDYLVSDGGVTALLASGSAGAIPEGFFTAATSTPAIVIARLGHGEAAEGTDIRLVRYIAYVMDRGRGYFYIDKILSKLARQLNDTSSVMSFMELDPDDTDIQVLSVKAPGSTATASYPQWKCEGAGIYVFITVRGLGLAW